MAYRWPQNSVTVPSREGVCFPSLKWVPPCDCGDRGQRDAVAVVGLAFQGIFHFFPETSVLERPSPPPKLPLRSENPSKGTPPSPLPLTPTTPRRATSRGQPHTWRAQEPSGCARVTAAQPSPSAQNHNITNDCHFKPPRF